MRERSDVYEADIKSDAGSSRSEEKDLTEKNDNRRPMGKHQEYSHPRPLSWKSGKSLRNEELEESNYGSDSSSSSHRASGNPSNPVQYTDQERAELLRKLDSIKDHLLRGANTDDKLKESYQSAMPFPGPGKHVPGPPIYRPYPEPFPYAGGHPMPIHGMYPSTSNPAHIPGYRDPYGFQSHRRPPNWYPGHYPNPMAHPYGPGQYVDIGSDILEPHPQDPMYHPFIPATPSRYGDVPYSPVSHHQEKFGPFGSQSYHSSSSFHTSTGSLGPEGHTRWPSDLDSEMGGAFSRGYVQKAISETDARCCRPLGGGAPFIACHSCFELLYLPKKVWFVPEKQQKLKCGACSEVISFTVVDKKLVFSSGHEVTNTVSSDVQERSTSAVVNDVVPNPHSHVNQPNDDSSSVNYNDPGNNFQCMEDESAEGSTKHRDTQTVQSQTPNEHWDDEKPKVIDKQQKLGKSVRSRVKDKKAPEPTTAPQGSSLLELFEYSNINRVALSYGMAQLSFNSDKQESYMKQDWVKPESAATETDVSYNESSYTGLSEDSRDSTKREEDSRPRSRNENGGNYVEATRKSSRDQNKVDGKSSEVWVNGHLIPEDEVRSAEIFAGPIQPGNYWYDYRAGFWGVMGKPCLGIIPPFIEEFSHPGMPDNCAGGSTGVFVNGRELHPRDLNLLAGRGLPRDRDRSYIVDISGRVLDGDSGEELKSLGKLAPTVEKVKHGFGMRVPRSMAL